MNVYKGYSKEQLEEQYNLRKRRPDYDTNVIPDWIERSNCYRQAHKNKKIDLKYGEDNRERLDLFSCAESNSSVLVYLHGGYWQRGDKSMYSFLAEPFIQNNVSFAVINYSLCPNVRIAEITPQIQKALIWLWRNAQDLGFSKDHLFLMGHSAGGQLTSRMMATDWSKHTPDIPKDMIKAGIPISSLIELEPLLHTSINDGLNMSLEEALAESPLNHPPATNAPQLVVVGGGETDEFHRQSDDYCEQIRTPLRIVERYSVPEADHFDELNELANDKSQFFKKVLALIKEQSK